MILGLLLKLLQNIEQIFMKFIYAFDYPPCTLFDLYREIYRVGYRFFYPPQAVFGIQSGIYFFLYTMAQLPFFTLITQKPCNLHICIIYHEKGPLIVLLMVFFA